MNQNHTSKKKDEKEHNEIAINEKDILWGKIFGSGDFHSIEYSNWNCFRLDNLTKIEFDSIEFNRKSNGNIENIFPLDNFYWKSVYEVPYVN